MQVVSPFTPPMMVKSTCFAQGKPRIFPRGTIGNVGGVYWPDPFNLSQTVMVDLARGDIQS